MKKSLHVFRDREKFPPPSRFSTSRSSLPTLSKALRLPLLTLFAILSLFTGSAWAAETTVTKTINEIATANSWSISSGQSGDTQYKSFSLDEIVSVSLNASDSNSGKCFNSSGTYQWRLYQTGKATLIVSCKSGYVIKSITVNYVQNNSGSLYDSNNTAVQSGSAVNEINNSEVSFTAKSSKSGTTNGQVRIIGISVTYTSTSTSTQCATPTISPSSQTFSEAFTAMISCTTSGAKIYYTTDGTTPTESSSEYSEGVSIPAETTTLKAIAYADGLDASEVATATYTYSSTTVEELDGLKALREAIKEDNITTASEAKTYKVKHAKLYVTRGNGTTNYMQDSECGVMCFGKDVVSVGASYDEGTATVTGYMYNGLVELTSFTTTGTAGTETTEPLEVTLEQLNTACTNSEDTYESRLVKVVKATVTDALDSSSSSKDYNGEISQNGQTCAIYRQGSSTDIVANLNATVDVVGVATTYNSASEILVFRKDDITEYTTAFYFSATEATATMGQEFTAPTLTNDYKDTTVTYSSSDESVATVAAGGKVTLVGAGTTTITASITADGETLTASYTLTVKAASSTTGEVIYTLVTSTNDITADDYLIVCRSKSAVMGGKSDDGKYASSVTVSSVNSSTTEINASDLPSEVAVVTLSGSAGAWNLYTSDGYINASSTNSQKDIKYQATAPNNATISISGNDAKIIWSTSASGYYLQYNDPGSNSKPRFKTYASTFAQGVTIQLFKKTYSTFYYSEKNKDVTIGKAFTAPTLNNEDGETVTYESSADSVATVNALGEVKIEGPGTVTITAATLESGKKATYTINVADDITSTSGVSSEYDEYEFDGDSYKVDDSRTITQTTVLTSTSRDNSTISITSNGDNKTSWYVVGSSSFSNALRIYQNTNLTISSSTKKIKKIVFTVLNDNTEDDGYSKGEVEFDKVTSGWNQAQDTWEATTDEGLSSVSFNGNKKKFFVSNIKVYFVGGTSTETVTLPITIRNKEGYATFYTNHPYKMPKGLQGSTVVVNSNAATTTATIKFEYKEQAEVPANTALLIKEVSPEGTTDSRTYNAELLSFTKAEKPSTNNLIGMLTYSKTVSPMDATLDSDYWFYNLSYSMQGTDIGWYWYNASGDEFDFDAYRCYLAIPKSSSSEAAPMSFVFGEDGDVTAISTATQNGQAPQAIYNLSGVRMNGTLQSLPKGIYIVNGKKVVK